VLVRIGLPLKILVNRRGHIGDVFWAEPLISDLIGRGHSVNLRSKYADMLHNLPKLTINEKTQEDLKIDLDGSYERTPKQHILLSYYQAAPVELGLSPVLRSPTVWLSAEERKQIGELQSPPYALFHLKWNHYGNYRRIYGVDWNEVSRKIYERYGLISRQLFGDPGRLSAPVLQTNTFRDIIPWIHRASLFVGVDSGPAHVAASLDIPTVVGFGSVNPAFRYLPESAATFLTAPCEFAGCYHDNLSADGYGQQCRIPGIGTTGVPKCAVQTTRSVLDRIEEILHV
jgi:ADP-heptose:LPS heptosyltransferase